MDEKNKLKGQIVFFSQNKLGGVQNYYRALIENDPIGSFNKTWILTRNMHDDAALPPSPYNITKELVFEYTEQNRSTYQRLEKLIPQGSGLVMTNFHLELEMLSQYALQKTIVHVCHDDFFLDIAVSYAYIIDAFVAHNYTYFEKLQELLPARKQDIYYLPYGITPSPYLRNTVKGGELKIIFLARYDKKKGIYDLFKIDDLLKEKGVRVSWTLVGDGPEKEAVKEMASKRENFTLKTLKDTDAVFREASEHDIFILPSYLDGLPVALLETMSAGLVPVISAFNTGISRVVKEDYGYIIPVGDNAIFSEKILYLNNNRELLERMGENARKFVLQEYNIVDKAREYYNFFGRYKQLKKNSWHKYRLHIKRNLFYFLKYRAGKQVRLWLKTV